MFKGLLITMVIALLIQGCASPKVSMRMLMPATSSEATQLRRIAVLPFRGSDGRETAEKLEARLVRVRANGALWFDVYERDRLKAALKEMRLGSSGLVDVNAAAKIGRFIGVQGIYMGSVNKMDTDKNTYYEKRKYCAEKNKKGKCVRWRTESVRCRSRYAVFGFTAKVVNVETARVVYSLPVDRTKRDNTCSGGFRLPDESILDVLRTEAILEFAKHVAPHYKTRDIVIKDSSDDLKGQQTAWFKAGVEFAKNERMDRACDLWDKAHAAGGASMALYYNLGLCKEYKGDMEAAEEWYYKADQLLMKPDEEVSKALNRVRAKRDAKRKLHNQTSSMNRNPS